MACQPMREISVPDELALRRHTSRRLLYVMHGSSASTAGTHGPWRPKAPDLSGVWPAGQLCPRSIRFDGSRAPRWLLRSLLQPMRYRGASLAALVRIPVRHAGVRAGVYESDGEGGSAL